MKYIFRSSLDHFQFLTDSDLLENVYSEILPASENAITSKQEVIKKFREISIEKNDILVSFDVKELYASVNTMEIANVVNKKLEKNLGKTK